MWLFFTAYYRPYISTELNLSKYILIENTEYIIGLKNHLKKQPRFEFRYNQIFDESIYKLYRISDMKIDLYQYNSMYTSFGKRGHIIYK